MLFLSACATIEAPEELGPGKPGAASPGDEPSAPQRPSDDGPLGSMGSVLLTPKAGRAVLEIDTGGDASLSATTVDAVVSNLREHGGKRVSRTGARELPARDVYSEQDLRDLSARFRGASSDGEPVAIHVLVLPGRFEEEGVPGVAFAATSFAVFPEEIERRLPPLTSPEPYVTAVAVHELGHLFGLVNLTGAGGFHESDEHPNHSADERSVMHWAIDAPAITDIFGSGPPTRFTAEDEREMQLIRDQA